MIETIKQALAAAYKSAYPSYDVRVDEVPNDFKKSSFVVMAYDFKYRKLLSNRYKGTLLFDDLYFPGGNLGSKRTEFLRVQEAVALAFTNIPQLKATSQSFRVVDNVLHHKYSIVYRELRGEDVSRINKALFGVHGKEN